MPDDLSLVHFYWGSAHPKKPPLHVTRNLALWSKKLEDTEFIPILWCDNNTFQGIEDNIHSTNTRDNSIASVAGMPIDREKWQRIPESLRDHPLWQDHHLASNLVLPKKWRRNIPRLIQTIGCHARMMLWLAEGDDYGGKKTEGATTVDSHKNKTTLFGRKIFVVNIEDFFESHIEKDNSLLRFFLYYFRECNKRKLFAYAKDAIIRIILYMLGGFYFDVDIVHSNNPFPQSLSLLQKQYSQCTRTTEAYLFSLQFFNRKQEGIKSDVGIYFNPFLLDFTSAGPWPLEDEEENTRLLKELRLLGAPLAGLRVHEKDVYYQQKLTVAQWHIQQYRDLYDREHPSFKKPYFSQLYPVEKKKPLKEQLNDQDKESAACYDEWFKRYLEVSQFRNNRSQYWDKDKWLKSSIPFVHPQMPKDSLQSPLLAKVSFTGYMEYERYLVCGKIIEKDNLVSPVLWSQWLSQQLQFFYRQYIEPCIIQQMNLVYSSFLCSPYQRLEEYDRAACILDKFFYRHLKQKTEERIQRILTSRAVSLLSAGILEELRRAEQHYEELSKSDRADVYRTLDLVEEWFFLPGSL